MAQPPPSASRPPSRQSTRLSTPLRSHPNYVRTDTDTRRSLRVQPATREASVSSQPTSITKSRKRVSTASTKSAAPKKSQKKSKKSTNNRETTSESDEDVQFLNLPQDSDEDNSKLTKQTKKPRGPNKNDYDDIGLYFEAPQYGEGNTDGKKLYYQCKWCNRRPYKASTRTRSNLFKHRDGDVSRKPCESRDEAIKNGANLPVTIKEKIEREKNASVLKNLADSNFDNRTLNQILVMWLMRSALPWMRIEDTLCETPSHCGFHKICKHLRLHKRVRVLSPFHPSQSRRQSFLLSRLERPAFSLESFARRRKISEEIELLHSAGDFIQLCSKGNQTLLTHMGSGRSPTFVCQPAGEGDIKP
ncbi:hypothetical protein PGT21_012046 [Puccinia graminis f. sp. tritici]|uniref:Uncharacterized protein n=1 Tax=Puccinia graminis f. sp. tritici TaxID=56615 RepID=A0A5B0MKY0_PUCGR|nr:hypothetical protein PGT21_012046 [Puccinia graminis f. sp. tritici]KAA1102830.1 hypothetical protein PGTUg99_036499 [Puccinia graminis f. sp. tritici]